MSIRRQLRQSTITAIAISVTGAALSTLLVLGAGCSTAANQGPGAQSRGAELNFDLSKCQAIDENMYRCPAIDKPICNPKYTPAGVECIKLGRQGGVYVMSVQE